MVVAQVRVVPVSGGWAVQVSDGATRPVEGRVEQARIDGLTPPSTPPSRWMSPGTDVGFTRDEDTFGRALGRALASAHGPWAHLQWLRGRAESDAEGFAVVIDTPDPGIRALPWELLALGDSGPSESVDAAVVCRFAPTGRRPPAEPRPTFAVWSGSDDPASAEVVAAIYAQCSAAGLIADPVAPSLLWLVAHGRAGRDALEVATADGPSSTAAVSARLGGMLTHASMVGLAVCHSGSRDADPCDSFVGRLCAAGVDVVAAPHHAVPVEGVTRFVGGVVGAFGRGDTVLSALAAGRRELRAWAFPHPAARWTAWTGHVGRLDALAARLRLAGWTPPGWPLPDAAAAGWLTAAHADAVRRGDGYVGVEHLLRTLPSVEGSGTATAALRRVARAVVAVYDGIAGALSPGELAEGVVPTPRMVRIGHGLAPRFGVEALAYRLLEPAGRRPDTVSTDRGDAALVPAAALEVVGGPEDGRVVRPRVGDVIGRAGGDAAVQLFVGTAAVDRRLSRRHFVWDGAGVVPIRPVEIDGHDGRRAHGPVHVGETIEATPGTWLRGVGG